MLSVSYCIFSGSVRVRSGFPPAPGQAGSGFSRLLHHYQQFLGASNLVIFTGHDASFAAVERLQGLLLRRGELAHQFNGIDAMHRILQEQKKNKQIR